MTYALKSVCGYWSNYKYIIVCFLFFFQAGVHLSTQHYQKAIKFCKFASSALQYEDSKTAIENLQKALTLLTTGQES